MKVYEGKREIDGLKVTVDGRPLSEHYEIKQFTTWGFEWTYEGPSPQHSRSRSSTITSAIKIAPSGFRSLS